MYRVELYLDNIPTVIHNEKVKLKSGSIKKGINNIDSFSFDVLPNNVGFNKLQEYKTLIKVFNEKRNKYEFQGRVLQITSSMEESGLLSKSIVCESSLGYLHDTEQDYVYEQNWTPLELLTHLLTVHNEMLIDEPEKHFKVGNVFSSENIYIGIQRENTWDCIMNKIIEKIGGELQLRCESDGMYIDIVEQLGTTKSTAIALSKNMKSIKKDSDPSTYVSKLIPLGAKIKDDEGNDTEERIDISSVNEGKKYIEDVHAIELYGVHIKHEYWEDVNEPSILKTKAINWLANNNKVLQKYSIDYIDLALLNLDIDFIDVGNIYPVKNQLLGIDEELRVISKTIDIVNITSSSIEIGDKFKTLSEIELERESAIDETMNVVKDYQINIPIIERNIDDLQEQINLTNKNVSEVTNELSSSIIQTSQQISSEVAEKYYTKDVTEALIGEVSTLVTQTKEGLEIQFTNFKGDLDNLNESFNSQIEETLKYIRFVDGTIKLGQLGNQIELMVQNDRISFMQSGIEVAYMMNNKLYITDGEFLNSLKIGKFAFVPRLNCSLDFKKVGD